MFEPPYAIEDPSSLLTPSLVIFRDLVRKNLDAMIAIARGPERLRPHAKTHKMPAVIRMAEAAGVHKHKCATIAEAEMIARAGGTDVFLAYPIVGPNIARMVDLIDRYPQTTFRVSVDDLGAARALSDAATAARRRPLSVLIDLNVGMGRTGIAPTEAFELCTEVAKLPGLSLDGLHAYDGHIRETDGEDRHRATMPGVEAVLKLHDRLRARGFALPLLILGGTPTFPIHAALARPGVECSPGTCIFHDAGYATRFPDLPFTPAAVLLTRVISRPQPGRLCLDLGHKAVAADPVGARLTLLGVPEATLGGQSEEHLVVDTPHASAFPPGTPLLAIPTHICPTCALHQKAYVVEDGGLVEEWHVAARNRVLD